jgi:hypothetical protein
MGSFSVSTSLSGQHILGLKVEDSVANEYMNVSAWVWVVDTTPPSSAIIAGPQSPLYSSSTEFRFRCSSPAANSAERQTDDCVSFTYSVSILPIGGKGGGCSLARETTHRGFVDRGGLLLLTGLRNGENTLEVNLTHVQSKFGASLICSAPVGVGIHLNSALHDDRCVRWMPSDWCS